MRIVRLLPLLLATAALLAGASVAMSGLPAHPAPAALAAPEAVDTAADERCAALRAEGLRVALADPAETAWCLVDEPALDTRYVQLLNVPSADAFAARKAQAAGALDAAGADLCRVTLWWVRRDGARAGVSVTDQYAAPRACPPRVVAHDPLAARWTELTERTIGDALARYQRDYGVRPSLPLTVHLYGARPTYTARVTAAQTSAEANARLAETDGVEARGTIEGAWIALDTSRFSQARPELAAFTIRHEAAHYLQTAAAGCACAFPVWFAEGMADMAAAAATGPVTGRHLAARAAERDGRALPLRELDDYPAGDAVASVYDRGYAAVSYLAERWGAQALADLLHYPGGDPAAFTRALTSVTGMSLDDFDRAVGRWLLSGVPEGAAAGRMTPRFVSAYAAYDPDTGRVAGEGSVFTPTAGQVNVVAAWDCAPGAHRVTARWYRPDGALFLEETSGGTDVRCPASTHSRLGFAVPGRTGGRVADTPGRWHVDLVADGRVAATLEIVIGE